MTDPRRLPSMGRDEKIRGTIDTDCLFPQAALQSSVTRLLGSSGTIRLADSLKV